MLILTRKEGEALLIGDNIEVVVVAFDGQHVRLGIEAPREVQVLREELHESLRRPLLSGEEAEFVVVQCASNSDLVERHVHATTFDSK